eukprot:TRINITY_DN6010_c0_g1_i1.p1 TRINITY_DN6010_c0_g1~~TRINITY_DN6010_c0_g1_i1.p1  ORF type:complete len:1865 (-),score=313.84 TRINITY_DN6010_c0_g1_i1:18-5456(-)
MSPLLGVRANSPSSDRGSEKGSDRAKKAEPATSTTTPAAVPSPAKEEEEDEDWDLELKLEANPPRPVLAGILEGAAKESLVEQGDPTFCRDAQGQLQVAPAFRLPMGPDRNAAVIVRYPKEPQLYSLRMPDALRGSAARCDAYLARVLTKHISPDLLGRLLHPEAPLPPFDLDGQLRPLSATQQRRAWAEAVLGGCRVLFRTAEFSACWQRVLSFFAALQPNFGETDREQQQIFAMALQILQIGAKLCQPGRPGNLQDLQRLVTRLALFSKQHSDAARLLGLEALADERIITLTPADFASVSAGFCRIAYRASLREGGFNIVSYLSDHSTAQAVIHPNREALTPPGTTSGANTPAFSQTDASRSFSPGRRSSSPVRVSAIPAAATLSPPTPRPARYLRLSSPPLPASMLPLAMPRESARPAVSGSALLTSVRSALPMIHPVHVQAMALADLHLQLAFVSPLTTTQYMDPLHSPSTGQGPMAAVVHSLMDDQDLDPARAQPGVSHETVVRSLQQTLVDNSILRISLLLELYVLLPPSFVKAKVAFAAAQHFRDSSDPATAERLLFEALYTLDQLNEAPQSSDTQSGVLSELGANVLAALGDVLLANHKYVFAVSAFEAALLNYRLRKHEAFFPLLRRLAGISADNNDWDRAVNFYQQLLDRSIEEGKSTETVYLCEVLSSIFADRLHQIASALHYINFALRHSDAPEAAENAKLDSQHVRLLLKSAQVHLQGHDCGKAVEILIRLKGAQLPHGQRPGVLLLLAQALLRLRRLVECATVLAEFEEEEGLAAALGGVSVSGSGSLRRPSRPASPGSSVIQASSISAAAAKKLASGGSLGRSALLGVVRSQTSAAKGSSLHLRWCELNARCARHAGRFADALAAIDTAIGHSNESSLNTLALLFTVRAKILQTMAHPSSAVTFPFSARRDSGTEIVYHSARECYQDGVGMLRRAYEYLRAVGDDVRIAKVVARLAEMHLQRVFVPVVISGEPLSSAGRLPFFVSPFSDHARPRASSFGPVRSSSTAPTSSTPPDDGLTAEKIEQPARLALEVATEIGDVMIALRSYVNLAEVYMLKQNTAGAQVLWHEASSVLLRCFTINDRVPLAAVRLSLGKKVLEVTQRLVRLAACLETELLGNSLALIDVLLSLQADFHRLDASGGYPPPPSSSSSINSPPISGHTFGATRSSGHFGSFPRGSLTMPRSQRQLILDQFERAAVAPPNEREPLLPTASAVARVAVSDSSVPLPDRERENVAAYAWAQLSRMASNCMRYSTGDITSAAAREANSAVLAALLDLMHRNRLRRMGDIPTSLRLQSFHFEEHLMGSDGPDSHTDEDSDDVEPTRQAAAQSENSSGAVSRLPSPTPSETELVHRLRYDQLALIDPAIKRLLYVLTLDGVLLFYYPASNTQRLRVLASVASFADEDTVAVSPALSSPPLSANSPSLQTTPLLRATPPLSPNFVAASRSEEQLRLPARTLAYLAGLVEATRESPPVEYALHEQREIVQELSTLLHPLDLAADEAVVALLALFAADGTPGVLESARDRFSTSSKKPKPPAPLPVPVVLIGSPALQIIPWELVLYHVLLVRSFSLSALLQRELKERTFQRKNELVVPMFFVSAGSETGKQHAALEAHKKAQLVATVVRQLQQHFPQSPAPTDREMEGLTRAPFSVFQTPLVKFGRAPSSYKRKYRGFIFVDTDEWATAPERVVALLDEECQRKYSHPLLLLTLGDLQLMSEPLAHVLRHQREVTCVFVAAHKTKMVAQRLLKAQDALMKGTFNRSKKTSLLWGQLFQFVMHNLRSLQQELFSPIVVFNPPLM